LRLSPEDIANDVRMTRSQHRGSFALVEGRSTDLLVFDRLIAQGSCQLTPADGKANVLGAVAILEADSFPGVLGIVDADRSRVSRDLPKSANILLTDGCDLESMLLRSPALDKVMAELGSAEKIEKLESERGKSIREHLAYLARPLGALRYISERDNLRLRFQERHARRRGRERRQGLAFSKFVDREFVTVDRPALVRTVKNYSQLASLDEDGLLAQLESIVADRRISSWDLSSGHDMVQILSLGLRKALGTRKEGEVSADALECSLRLAYEKEHFRASGLCAAIRDWERRNPAYAVLD